MPDLTLAGIAGLRAWAAAITAAAASKLAAWNAASLSQNLKIAATEAVRAQDNLRHYVFGYPQSNVHAVTLPSSSAWKMSTSLTRPPMMGPPGALFYSQPSPMGFGPQVGPFGPVPGMAPGGAMPMNGGMVGPMGNAMISSFGEDEVQRVAMSFVDSDRERLICKSYSNFL
jgi:hypothetical protein